MVNLCPLHSYPDAFLPKRVLKYVLVWCSKGALSLVVDGSTFVVGQHQLITITSGQVHYFNKLEGAEGIILEFGLDFFSKNDHDLELIFQNGLFCHFDQNEVISVPAAFNLREQLNQIEEELRTKPYQYLISIHARISLMLVSINRAKVERGEEIWKPEALFLKFLELVRASFGQHVTLPALAERLGTSVAKLNEQAKRYTGKTAQSVMHGLLVSEAKRRLLYQKESVKEVAFSLGFQDPFYFSNFFKKHAQLSPKAFQAMHGL